jgi:hypothetical protein
MRTIIESRQGTDAELLAELNRKQFKRTVNDGLVSLAMVAAVSEPLAGKLALTIKRTIQALEAAYTAMPAGEQRDATEAQHDVFVSFNKRLLESSYGAPINHDSFRATFTGLATQAGWSAVEIETFLSLGAVVESSADLSLGRDATQDDVDAVRLSIERDAALSGVIERINAAQGAASLAHEQGLSGAEIIAAAETGWGG